ncbi:unnamed protein product, partial [Durusdinium trenchii]
RSEKTLTMLGAMRSVAQVVRARARCGTLPRSGHRIDFAAFAAISRPQQLHRHRKRLEGFGKDVAAGDAKTLADCRELLKDDDWFARKVAVDTLRQVSMKGDETQLSLLYTALEDEDIFVREAAVDAVVQVAHPQDPLALSKVSVSLSDEDCFVRTRAVVALGSLGQVGDQQLVGLLMDMLEDGFVPVRKRAIEALSRLSNDESVLERLRSGERGGTHTILSFSPHFWCPPMRDVTVTVLSDFDVLYELVNREQISVS